MWNHCGQIHSGPVLTLKISTRIALSLYTEASPVGREGVPDPLRHRMKDRLGVLPYGSQNEGGWRKEWEIRKLLLWAHSEAATVCKTRAEVIM